MIAAPVQRRIRSNSTNVTSKHTPTSSLPLSSHGLTSKRSSMVLESTQPSLVPSPTSSLNLHMRPTQPLNTSSITQVTRFSQAPSQPSPSSSSSSQIPRLQQTSLYKRAQSVGATSEASRQRMIERATKARLYLLHQSGPNRFLIGGDAVNSRFHVTIGSQVIMSV